MKLVLVIIICILFLIGVIFIIWGIIEKLNNIHLINSCTNSCEGTLIKIEEIEIEHDRSSDSMIHDKIKSYVPVYQYYVKEQKYILKGTNGSGFRIGDIVNINYNPQDPSESYIAGYSFKAYKAILILGIIFIFMALMFLFLAILIY